jgi:hypothetical protein
LSTSLSINGVLAMSKIPKVQNNPFEPRPPKLPVGDADPNALLYAIGAALSAWEMTEVTYSYLFNTLTRPRTQSPAIRRAYGSIIASRSRREMIEAAADVFFHNFPDAFLQRELADFMNIYSSGAARRNEFAHGIVASNKAGQWYLEANLYSNKRTVSRESPFAYTSAQINKIASQFTKLNRDVNAFQATLMDHFALSSNTKARERY